MRYAILSDIHANVAALRAVLADAADMHAERIVCLGDILGYGPDPVEALELTYRRAHVCLAGNHDDAVSGRYPLTDFTELAASAVLRHRAALAQNAIDWLRHLPHACEFPAADGGTADGAFACAHADLADPKSYNYVLEPDDALPSWRARTEQLLLVGHTHKPGIFVTGASGTPHLLEPMDFELEPGKRYLVNVGSVGYPRSALCRSFYCIYDDQARAVFFRSLPFDLEGYREKMNGRGLDEAPWIAARARQQKKNEIRGTETFGKPAAKREQPHAAAPAPPPSRPSASSRIGAAIVAGAGLLVLGGAWCAARLAGALQDERRKTESVQEIPVPPPAPDASAAVPEREFPASLPLFGGWEACFEIPERQHVRVDRNVRKGVTAFRLESETNGVIRLMRRTPLLSRPKNVFYSVNLLTTVRPGLTLPFQFVARVLFYDRAGRRIDVENVHTGRRSVKDKRVVVPSTAEAAELRIDCQCEGTFEMAIPVFGPEPLRKPSSCETAPKPDG